MIQSRILNFKSVFQQEAVSIRHSRKAGTRQVCTKTGAETQPGPPRGRPEDALVYLFGGPVVKLEKCNHFQFLLI